MSSPINLFLFQSLQYQHARTFSSQQIQHRLNIANTFSPFQKHLHQWKISFLQMILNIARQKQKTIELKKKSERLGRAIEEYKEMGKCWKCRMLEMRGLWALVQLFVLVSLVNLGLAGLLEEGHEIVLRLLSGVRWGIVAAAVAWFVGRKCWGGYKGHKHT